MSVKVCGTRNTEFSSKSWSRYMVSYLEGRFLGNREISFDILLLTPAFKWDRYLSGTELDNLRFNT